MADYSTAFDIILKKAGASPSPSLFRDALSQIHGLIDRDGYDDGIRHRGWMLRHSMECALRSDTVSVAERLDILEIYRDSLLYEAPFDFDCYMRAMEFQRDPAARFYEPRRARLFPIVDALQKLADDGLDELFISQPPRTGKTTLVQFYLTWLMGRDPEASNLYVSYSDTITDAFYGGLLELLTDGDTYCWNTVFPGLRIADKNAAKETINIGRRKKYASATCRSIFGTLNGACDCKGLLIGDDLVEGIETAMSPDRLSKLWSTVCNDMMSRAVGDRKKFLWMGTRWSIYDPIGRRLDQVANDPEFADWRYEVVNIPALGADDTSNFDYAYGVGFTTADYRRLRSGFEHGDDMASWFAQYMGDPIEREGTLFPAQSLRYFNGTLPEGIPDRVFMAVDPAFGGGDYTSAPVCVQFGEDIFVPDVAFSNEDKSISQPIIVRKAEKWDVAAIQFEVTKSTRPYKEDVDKLLHDRGLKLNITSKPAPTNIGKNQRIFDKAPDIKETFVFLEDGHRSKEYQSFMQQVFGFKMMGKNKHDDAPDSLSMCADMARRRVTPQIYAAKRPF